MFNRQRFDRLDFISRQQASAYIVNTGFSTDRFGYSGVIARQHHGLDVKRVQLADNGVTFRANFISQRDKAAHTVAIRKQHRCLSIRLCRVYQFAQIMFVRKFGIKQAVAANRHQLAIDAPLHTAPV